MYTQLSHGKYVETIKIRKGWKHQVMEGHGRSVSTLARGWSRTQKQAEKTHKALSDQWALTDANCRDAISVILCIGCGNYHAKQAYVIG